MDRNRTTALIAVGVVAGMLGLAYASVPLYELFCRATGYGGTTRTAEAAPGQLGDRRFTIRFNADTARDLAWQFRPVQPAVTVRSGEETLAFYVARNQGDRPVTGVATFNVTPDKAGLYFDKVDCFCFSEQTLAPGQEVQMPVSFFIDPAIEQDRNLDEVRTITLSYTFFEAPNQDRPRKVSDADSRAVARE